jgi:hypothetical protein
LLICSGGSGTLEGSIYKDEKFPNKKLIEKYSSTSEPVKSLLIRKKDYIARFEASKKSFAQAEALASKRAREEHPSDDETAEDRNGNVKKLPKREKKRQRGMREGRGEDSMGEESVEEEVVGLSKSPYSMFPSHPIQGIEGFG